MFLVVYAATFGGWLIVISLTDCCADDDEQFDESIADLPSSSVQLTYRCIFSTLNVVLITSLNRITNIF